MCTPLHHEWDGTPGALRFGSRVVSWNDRALASGRCLGAGHRDFARIDPSVRRRPEHLSTPADDIRLPSARHPAIPVQRQGPRPASSAPTALACASAAPIWVFNNLTVASSSANARLTRGHGRVQPDAVSDVDSCKNNTLSATWFQRHDPLSPLAPTPPTPVTPEATGPAAGRVLEPHAQTSTRSRSVVWTPWRYGGECPISASYECSQRRAHQHAAPHRLLSTTAASSTPTSSLTPRIWSGQVLLSRLDALAPRPLNPPARCAATAPTTTAMDTQIDNEEHPASYSPAWSATRWSRQNFLVVRGDVACPTAPRRSIPHPRRVCGLQHRSSFSRRRELCRSGWLDWTECRLPHSSTPLAARLSARPSPSTFSGRAGHWLERAQSARRLRHPLAPNGRVLGSGHTQAAGQAHAEVMALRDAARLRGHDVRGATALVTLEPCAHQGRTPPCCDALISARRERGLWPPFKTPTPRWQARA